MKNIKTAKDRNGNMLRVGDKVRCFTYDGIVMNSGIILAMLPQGIDGTTLKLDTPPDPNYKHHFNHRAKYTELI